MYNFFFHRIVDGGRTVRSGAWLNTGDTATISDSGRFNIISAGDEQEEEEGQKGEGKGG